jgi:hypothetical protein
MPASHTAQTEVMVHQLLEHTNIGRDFPCRPACLNKVRQAPFNRMQLTGKN